MDDVGAQTPTDPPPSPTDQARGATPSTDQLERFRRWAMTLFALLLVVIAVAILLLGNQIVERATMEVLVGLLGVALGVGALLALLIGLYRRYPWAIPAAIWSCWILIAAAIVHLAVDLGRGNLTIPLEGIAAAVVLTRRPATWPARSIADGRLAVLVTLLFLASEAWPLLTDAVRAGQVLGAPREALTLTTAVECSGLRDVTADGQPDRVLVTTIAWAWSGAESLAGGNDGMLVHWAADGETPEGEAWSPVLVDDGLDAPGPGIWRGMAGPSTSLLQGREVGTDLEVGIDVGARGLTDGSVEATLIPSTDPAPAHGSVRVWADYAHLDRWLVTSDPVTCTW